MKESLTEKVNRIESELIPKIDQRMKEVRRLREIDAEYVELSFREKTVWKLISIWESLERAKNYIKAKDTRPMWKKIIGGSLTFAKYVIIILAGFYSKKLPS